MLWAFRNVDDPMTVGTADRLEDGRDGWFGGFFSYWDRDYFDLRISTSGSSFERKRDLYIWFIISYSMRVDK